MVAGYFKGGGRNLINPKGERLEPFILVCYAKRNNRGGYPLLSLRFTTNKVLTMSAIM